MFQPVTLTRKGDSRIILLLRFQKRT
jgi:hypothetical protein